MFAYKRQAIYIKYFHVSKNNVLKLPNYICPDSLSDNIGKLENDYKYCHRIILGIFGTANAVVPIKSVI